MVFLKKCKQTADLNLYWTWTTCKLKLGDAEEYIASGPSIKKAQHAAAAIALEKTKLKHPPPKSRLVKNSEL